MFEAKTGEKILAKAEGAILGDKLNITGFSGDVELFDGVCRAMMSYGLNHGVRECEFSENIPEKLLEALPAKRRVELKEFFKIKKCGDICS